MIRYDILIPNGIMSDGSSWYIPLHIYRSLGGTNTGSCFVIVQVCKSPVKFSHVFCSRRRDIAIQCLLESNISVSSTNVWLRDSIPCSSLSTLLAHNSWSLQVSHFEHFTSVRKLSIPGRSEWISYPQRRLQTKLKKAQYNATSDMTATEITAWEINYAFPANNACLQKWEIVAHDGLDTKSYNTNECPLRYTSQLYCSPCYLPFNRASRACAALHAKQNSSTRSMSFCISRPKFYRLQKQN